MGGDNMESLLLHGDDSSSGESDSEIAVSGSTAASIAVQRQSASVNIPPNSSSVAPGPSHAPQAHPQGAQVSSQPSQSEMTARLKSMFSPATKNSQQAKPPVSASQTTQPISSLPPSAQRPQAQSVPQQPNQRAAPTVPIPQPSQYHRSNSASSSHPGVPLPSSASSSHGQQQQLPVHQRPMASSGGGVTHQQSSQQRRTSAGQPPPQNQGPPSFSSRGGMAQSSNPGTHTVGVGVPDPFEPTPVSAIMERSKVAHPSSHQQHASTPFTAAQPMMSSTHSTSSASSHRSASGYQPGFQPGVPSISASVPPLRSTAPSEREVKIYKERFLVFTRVLVKYLEQKNPALHQTVKAIIKECVERNKRQEVGYESVTTSMRKRLKEVVHDTYWKKAESYLDQFLKGKAKTGSSSAMALAVGNVPPSAASVSPGTVPLSTDMRRKQEMERAQMQQQASASRSPQQLSPNMPPGQLPPAPTVSSVQQDIAKKRQSLGKTAAVPTGPPTPPVPSTVSPLSIVQPPAAPIASTDAATTPVSLGGGAPEAKKSSKPRSSKATPSTLARKTSIGLTAGTGISPLDSIMTEANPLQQSAMLSPSSVAPQNLVSTAHVKPAPPPVREYSEFMELVDHAVYFDWTVAGLLMDKEQSEMLSAEQKALFDETKRSLPSKLLASTDATMHTDRMIKAFPIPGWSRRNVLSSRTAWALVRLPEEEAHTISAKSPNLVVGDLFSLPAVPASHYSPIPNTAMFPHSWHNEQNAEEDEVLAVLSEGLQIYLRGVIEKAAHCARQRYNVDGVRLWHQQTSVALKAKLLAKENKSNNKEGSEKNEAVTLPPLTLRLGCDVNRQVAQAAGNAAMTVKRMEEALQRLDDIPNQDVFTAETEASCVLRANSMSELAMLPKLGKAIENADYNGKRCFEVYGGKFSSDPPLGRVPKQPRIELVDFQMGMNFSRRYNRRSRAGTMASSFFF